jgi:hypothetical protein
MFQATRGATPARQHTAIFRLLKLLRNNRGEIANIRNGARAVLVRVPHETHNIIRKAELALVR